MDRQSIQKMIDDSLAKVKNNFSFIGQYKVDTPLDANQVVPKRYVDTIAKSADFSVSDGVHTIHPVSSIIFLNNAVVSGGSGIANVSILSSGGGGSSPGGADTNVQYNSSGNFAGNSAFTYNGSGHISLNNGGNDGGIYNTTALYLVGGTDDIQLNSSQTLLDVGSGHLNIQGIPVSSAGLNTGDVWCDTTGGLNILKLK